MVGDGDLEIVWGHRDRRVGASPVIIRVLIGKRDGTLQGIVPHGLYDGAIEILYTQIEVASAPPVSHPEFLVAIGHRHVDGLRGGLHIGPTRNDPFTIIIVFIYLTLGILPESSFQKMIVRWVGISKQVPGGLDAPAFGVYLNLKIEIPTSCGRS